MSNLKYVSCDFDCRLLDWQCYVGVVGRHHYACDVSSWLRYASVCDWKRRTKPHAKPLTIASSERRLALHGEQLLIKIHGN